ncbi:hypothetical protein H5410_036516 [Solanum commersonii]|uniref:Uncharacterized protein n=1 Tax=Solanum commersonii TaxID=4109 RepID=A0A9J5Y7P0_SOLCO|nr:hypothetical protein H5410_036516 [Solanum commersonii]
MKSGRPQHKFIVHHAIEVGQDSLLAASVLVLRRGAANFAMESSNMHSRNFNRPTKIDTALNYFNKPGSITPTDLYLGVTSTWSFKSKQGSRWVYSTARKCETMPSTRLLNVKIKALLCFEQEGMIWIWPANDPPAATLSF